MRAENNRKAVPARKAKRKTRTRILKWVLALVVVLIMLVVFLVPAFVSSEKGRKIILAKINDSIDGKANFGSFSLSWWKGVKVTDFSFNDSSGSTLVEVRQIATKPHYGSILMGGLSFGETIIFEPKVEINLKGHQAEPSTGKTSQATALPIKKIDLIVNDGNLKVTSRQAETVELTRINSRVNLRPPGQQTNFDIDMAVVDKSKESKIRTVGQITPHRRTGWSLKGASGNVTVEVNDLDIASLGPIFALGGVEIQAKGEVWANIKGEVKDGQFVNLRAKLEGKDLDVTVPQLKGDRLKSSTLGVAIELASSEELINIDNFEIQADWLTVRASGVVPKTFKSLAQFIKSDSKYDLKGSFECDVAAAMSQMPQTLGLKEEIKVTSGKLSGTIETLTEAGQRKIHGQASLDGLEGVVDGKRIALSEPVRAEAEITSDESKIIFEKVDVSASFARISCTGSSELLKYNADLDLAKLQAELGQFIDIGEYQMSGEVLSEGEVSGSEDKIAAVGSAVVKELRLSSTEGVSAFEPKADIVFSVIAEPAKSVLNVDFIEANASFGQVSTKDAVLPLNKKAAKPMSLPISAKVDLQKLQPFAVLLASFPKEMQLSGVAESQIAVSSKEDSYYISTDSTKIRNLKLESAGQQPFEQEQVSLVFDAEVNPVEKTVTVRKLQLISPQIKIEGNLEKNIEGSKSKLQGKVDLEYDWAAVSAVVSPFLAQGLRLEGQRKDSISFASEYPAGQTDKLLANLSAKAKLGFERAEYMGLNFVPTEVDIQIQNGLLRIAPFSSTVNNGRFNFAGEADFKQKPTLFRTPGAIQIIEDIQINDETTRKLLMYLNPLFANAVNISGVANFNCERLAIPLAGADKDDLEVAGTVSVKKLRLQASDLLGQILSLVGTSVGGKDITIHPTRFVLQNGFLRYDNMQMDIGDNPVNFKGVIGLDKSLNMTVTLPYTLKGRTARVGERDAGKRITLPLKGTIDNPKLDLAKLLEEQAIEMGLELLEELLK